MIFNPHQTRLILQGRKTQTRRPAQPERPCRWRTGRAYAIQDPATHRAQTSGDRPLVITIASITRHVLMDITLADARREGYRTRAGFLDAWADEYGLPPTVPVWAITFALGDHTDTPRLLAARATRGDYTTEPHLAVRDEPEALNAAQLDRLSRRARHTEHEQPRAALADPLARIRHELDAMHAQLQAGPDRALSRAVARVEHHVNALARHLQ